MKKYLKISSLFLLTGCQLNYPYVAEASLEDNTDFHEVYEMREQDQQDLENLENYQVKDHFYDNFSQQVPPLDSVAHEKRALHGQTDSYEFYRWAAKKGHTRAYLILANTHLDEDSEHYNPEKAIEYLKLGVEKDDHLCRYYLAHVYIEQEQYSQASEILKPLIEEDYLPALRLAAHIAHKNNDQALEIVYLDRARLAGDLQAQSRLEELVVHENNIASESHEHQLPYEELKDLKGFWHPEQEKKTFEKQYFHKPSRTLTSTQEDPTLLSQALERGSAYAAFIKARQLFEKSYTHAAESEELLKLLERAQEIPAAKVYLARALFHHKVKCDKYNPHELLLQAAQDGSPYALFYQSIYARVVEKDYKISTQYYYDALKSSQGQEAQFNCALDLMKEFLPFRSQKTAHQWLIDLASENYPPALLEVADLKENKKILSQSDREIFLHRAKAATEGIPEASYQVGNMYLKGVGVQQNDKKAFMWFLRSARSGYQPAQYQVSVMYKNGIGIIPSYVNSYAWMSLMPQIFEHQEEYLEDLKTHLNDKELDKALKMSETLMKYYSN